MKEKSWHFGGGTVKPTSAKIILSKQYYMKYRQLLSRCVTFFSSPITTLNTIPQGWFIAVSFIEVVLLSNGYLLSVRAWLSPQDTAPKQMVR
jgi:hypothetical protein